MGKDSKPLTNEGDPTIAELCNATTGEIASIPTRHDGGKRAAALLASGWRKATDQDREDALARAEANAKAAGQK